MKALSTALYGKLAGSALAARIGTRFYKIEAPQGATYPYIVFFVVTDVPEYPGGKTIEQFNIQFSLFSATSGTTEIEDILTDLWTLYDDVVMTITGYSPIYFMRGLFSTGKEDHTTPAGTVVVWHYVQEYDGWIVKT